MDDPQEYKSLDELFRKTFEDLPNQAAPSGWDAPSPRVWDQVRDQIQTPKSGWSGKSILLISSLAIVLMLGLYWAFSPTATTEITEPSTEINTTAGSEVRAQVLEDETSTALTAAQPTSPSVQPKPQTQTNTRRQSNAAEDSTSPSSNTEQEGDGVRRRLPGSAPLPGTNPASPNTTIRRQMEEWRGAPWAQPLAPLPSILESEFIRPVPESLKRIGN